MFSDLLQIQVVKRALFAKMPTKTYPTDAGWDLYSVENTIIEPMGRAVVDTGISISIPKGMVGLIWPRSGLSVKSGIDVLAGVIDTGYIGPLKVCLHNTDTATEYRITMFDRIAQLVIQKVCLNELVEVKELKNTDRGESGFGSSGV